METTQNIKAEAIILFNTILATKQVYGMAYLVRLVRGDKYFELKKPEHEKLETFGTLANMYDYQVKNILSYLLKNGYLTIVKLQYGSLGLTAKAYLLMHSEEELLVEANALKTTAENRVLSDSLKRIRKDIAEKEQKAVYEIFTDWSMQKLIDEKPKNVSALKLLAPMNEAYIDSYAHLFLQAIEMAKAESVVQLQALLQEKVKTPEYQMIKALFLSHYTIEKMAKERQVEVNTILSYLGDLHKAGEIDLKPWIQARVDAKELHKATTFFAQTQGTFNEALQVLGLDYQTLRLAKLYISKVEVREETF